MNTTTHVSNEDRDSMKSVIDLAISSQATEQSAEGSTTNVWSPPKWMVKRHELGAIKKCKICNEVKSIKEFYKMASGNPEAKCKECKKINCKQRYYSDHEINKAKYGQYKIERRKTVDESEYRKQYYQNNIERLRPIYNAHSAKRRARILNAIPKWADFNKIDDLYRKASVEGLCVDHIIPISGKLVSGLHIHTNMQLLTISENCKKSNKFIDDIVWSSSRGEE